MEWIRPILISIIIISCLVTVLVLLHSGRCRANLYELDDNKSKRLDNSDDDLGDALSKVEICNNPPERVVSNGYNSQKL